jgi:hypothetical protein
VGDTVETTVDKHPVDPADNEKVPAEQEVQSKAPLAEYVPTV